MLEEVVLKEEKDVPALTSAHSSLHPVDVEIRILTAWLELLDQGIELHIESRQSRIRGDVNKSWSGPPPLIRTQRGPPILS